MPRQKGVASLVLLLITCIVALAAWVANTGGLGPRPETTLHPAAVKQAEAVFSTFEAGLSAEVQRQGALNLYQVSAASAAENAPGTFSRARLSANLTLAGQALSPVLGKAGGELVLLLGPVAGLLCPGEASKLPALPYASAQDALAAAQGAGLPSEVAHLGCYGAGGEKLLAWRLAR